MKLKLSFSLAILCCLNTVSAIASQTSRPDAHAPIGVMADHGHNKGEFMFSYRYMNMQMDGNREGTEELSSSEVLEDYMVTPLNMTMEMHMLGMMYAPSDLTTLMLMVPVLESSMDHVTRMNTNFTTEASGLGDIKVGAIFSLEKTAESTLLATVAISLPTGSIDEEDIIPGVSMTEDTQLPFPMQIGSGTYDLHPSVTYTRALESRSWGTQLSSVLRLDNNDNGYTLGDRLQAQAWHAWMLNDAISLSSRLSLERWGNIDGDDEARTLPTNITMMNGMTIGSVPTVDPDNQGGQRADLGLGVNTLFGDNNHRVAFEVVLPVYQNLDGPQMQRDLTFTLGYQKAF